VEQAGMVGLANNLSRSRAELREFSANHHQARLAGGEVAFFGYLVPGNFSHSTSNRYHELYSRTAKKKMELK
jgi:hypothetical protein